MINSNQIAVIPARKNSKGLKDKNLIFFDFTAKFVKNLNIFDKIIVSSDDNRILSKSKKFKFINHKRKKKYSLDNTSIKNTLINVCKEMKLHSNDIIWLFYLPLLFRRKKDFLINYKTTKMKGFKSLCSFRKIDNLYHPYYSWQIGKKFIKQYVFNKIHRRQDLPKAFIHYHYISCFKKKELVKLNEELINNNTTPWIIDNNLDKKLIEVDTKEDYNKYKNAIKNKKIKK